MNKALSRYCFDSLPSTNAKAWELLDQGIVPPFWVTASQQTAGRGQWGRVWQSSPGGLYLSLAIAFDFPLRCLPHLILFSAWGIADSLRQAKIPVDLKWPNDLILAGRKLGGIKSEIRSHKQHISHAVIGVGINICNAIPETGISLQEYQTNCRLQKPWTLTQVEDWTGQGIIKGYQRYINQGIDYILNDYTQILRNIGQEITFQGMTGTIIGINDQGELKVRLRSQGARTEIHLPIGSIQLGYN